MEPIPTHYDGYYFRSRLEARWAVFFNTLGIRYDYEKQGYTLADGTWYLPDFWLSEQECWIEIKGQEPTEEEHKKARLLAVESGRNACIFYGNIWIPHKDDTYPYHPYPGESIELIARKGAYGYNGSHLNILGENPQSPCPCRLSNADVIQHRFEECPNTTNLEMGGMYDHLIQALYAAEFSFPFDGDRCKLRMTADGEIQYIVPAHRMNNKNPSSPYRKIPLPVVIQMHEQAFRHLLSTKPPYWEWGVGAVGDLYPEPVCRWHECKLCHSLKIMPVDYSRWNSLLSNEHKDHRCFCVEKASYSDNEYLRLMDEAVFRDDTPRLITAYNAARSARFER